MELKEPTQVEQLAEQVARLSARIADLEGPGRRRKARGRRGIAVVASAVVALSIGGIALAGIPDTAGVIHGCYAKAGPHTLSVIDTSRTSKCPSGTSAVNWNQRGVQGDPGPQGDPGQQGNQGPPGPSGVSYGAYTYDDATKDMLASGGYEVVASATLPPGDYLVVGTTLAWPDGSDFIDCRIDDGAYYSSSHSEGETIAVTDHVFLSQQGDVTFQCRSEDGDASSYVFQGSLSVIKLNQVAVSFQH